MKVAFWSKEDGCGTTSSMAAVASVCAYAWNKKAVLLQSIDQDGDLYRKLEPQPVVEMVQEGRSSYAFDGLDFLIWQERNQKLTERMVQQSMVIVAKGRVYYIPQGAVEKSVRSPDELKELMWQVICRVEQFADLVFIDCGSKEDGLSEYLRSKSDVVVVNLLQERHTLDAYFKEHYIHQEKSIYLVDQYQPDSIYNRKNLNRLYRLGEDELGVVLHNPFFRHASDRGKVERFIRRHIYCNYLNQHFGFMQELLQSAYLILKAGGVET